MKSSPNSAVSLREVYKHYGTGGNSVKALEDVTIDFNSGTFTAIMGPSGSGKSTLLQCAAGLDLATQGAVRIGKTDVASLTETGRTLLRRDTIGFIFQSFNLVSALTAEENAVLPLRLAGRSPGAKEAADMLDMVGLGKRKHHRPNQLSGGEQQRVAVARALLAKPSVLFADEPTGALDSVTGQEVLKLLRELADKHNQTIVMVTHDPVAASFADKVVFLADGRIVDELSRSAPRDIAAKMAGLERVRA